jgi:hypothetical protein
LSFLLNHNFHCMVFVLYTGIVIWIQPIGAFDHLLVDY